MFFFEAAVEARKSADTKIWDIDLRRYYQILEFSVSLFKEDMH